jgi:hypothetical protein
LVILLPSCDEKSCVTGAISVTNEAGTVILDVAYQATLVSGSNSPPSEPRIINIDQANINNMLILAPPIKTEEVRLAAASAIDVNYLNQDLLKYDELDKNYLEDVKELDMNLLDNDFLVNMLDLDQLSSPNQLDEANQMLPKFNTANNIKYFFNDDKSKITLTRDLYHVSQVAVGTEQNAVINIIQDGVRVSQQVNQGGTTSITIIQTK